VVAGWRRLNSVVVGRGPAVICHYKIIAGAWPTVTAGPQRGGRVEICLLISQPSVERLILSSNIELTLDSLPKYSVSAFAERILNVGNYATGASITVADILTGKMIMVLEATPKNVD
jgi:hypothetical protein